MTRKKPSLASLKSTTTSHCFFSEKLDGASFRYSTYAIELYAIVQAIKHSRRYLFHKEFILYTDHDAFKHLISHEKLSSCHASWISYLQQFTFVIKRTSGTSNHVADALSRSHSVMAILRVSVPSFSSFVDLYPTYLFFGRILEDTMAGRNSDYTI